MSAGTEQNILLNAIVCLQSQYRFCRDPCIALSLCRHYRLLARRIAAAELRASYSDSARAWLLLYMQSRGLPPQLQSQLANYVLTLELN